MNPAENGPRPAAVGGSGGRDPCRELLDHVPDAIARVDRELRHVLVNAAFERLMGKPPRRGRPDGGARDGWTTDELGLPAPVAVKLILAFREVLDGGERRTLELELPGPEGTRWLDVRLAPERGPSGAVESVAILARDMTAQKRAEDELRRHAFDLGERVKELRFLYAAATELAQAEEDLEGSVGRIARLLPSAFQEPGCTHARIVVDDREFLSEGFHETPHRLAAERGGAGSTRVLVEAFREPPQSSGCTLFLAEEQPLLDDLANRIAETARRRRAEQASREHEAMMRQAQKLEAVGRLAGGIAHDFNNLLMVIGGHARLLEPQLAEEDPRRTHVEEIVRTSDRAAGVTRRLLAFSRQQPVQARVVDLNAVLHDLARLLRALVGDAIRLELDTDEQPCPVSIDPGQFEQVVVNLAANARDAMPRGGRLRIATRFVGAAPPGGTAAADVVRVEVSDEGVGIGPEALEHVFEPFFTTKANGTGLGLATTYGIVQQAGGTIRVASEPGRGTTFTLELPAAPVPAEGSGGAEPPAPPEPPARPATVLLVEDAEPVRELVTEMLSIAGYRVLAAGDADEALRRLEQEPADLLLTDVALPGRSGPELARAAVALRPGLAVLFMSAFAPELGEGSPALEGFAGLLEKPFRPDELLRRVREALPPRNGRS